MSIIDIILRIPAVLQLMSRGMVFHLAALYVTGVRVEFSNLDVTMCCVKFLYPCQNRNMMAASGTLPAARAEPQMRPIVARINRQKFVSYFSLCFC
jgi:hypothetical protein